MPYDAIHGPNKFADGMVKYLDDHPNRLGIAQIVIPVTFGRSITTLAVVDTGSPWCILGPEEANSLDFDYRSTGRLLREFVLLGWKGPGWLCELPVSVRATDGQDLSLQANVFVPQLQPSAIWDFPNFLGYSGFLEKVRFAVDPENNLFYFGRLGDEP